MSYYDVVDHPTYSLNDIVTFSDLDVVPQAQGRIVSMYSEHEDLHDVQLVLMMLRRPFGEGNTPPKDYIGEGYKIYEYWDSTECLTISEHIVLDVIDCTSAKKDEVDPHEFFDEFSKSSLAKGVILITGFHDNETGYLYDTVEPHIILSHYQTDIDSREWEQPVKGKLPVHQLFVGLVKEKLFDPFITPYYRSSGNHELFAYLLANFDNKRMMKALESGTGHPLLKNKNMLHPSLSIPVIVTALHRYWSYRDDSVASILDSLEGLVEEFIEPCLKKISGVSHTLASDPVYDSRKRTRAGDMSDEEEEEEEDGKDLDDFIENDLCSEDDDRSNGGKSVTSDELRKKRRFFEDAASSSSVEEEEEEEDIDSYSSSELSEESSCDEEEEDDEVVVIPPKKSTKRPRSGDDDNVVHDLTAEEEETTSPSPTKVLKSTEEEEVSSSQMPQQPSPDRIVGKKRSNACLVGQEEENELV